MSKESIQYTNYNWIDENIAIGDYKSDYSEFDIIVNLDCPNNGVDHHSIDMQCLEKIGKHIYRIGCYDSERENMESLIKTLLPELVSYYIRNNNIRILFHCYAGISRSSTLAIAFLCIAKKYPLFTAYGLAKSKRSIINPNRGFMNCLIRNFI